MAQEILRVVGERFVFDEVLKDVRLNQHVQDHKFLYEFKESSLCEVFILFRHRSIDFQQLVKRLHLFRHLSLPMVLYKR